MAKLPFIPDITNQPRRTLLFAGVAGVGAFVATKLLSQFTFNQDSEVVRSATFENFTFEETGDEMTLREKNGEVIFVVDKASFKE
jgi:hypothetical protein